MTLAIARMHLDLHLFADDSNLFFPIRNYMNLKKLSIKNLKHVNIWLSANKLSLNIDKSNFILFHPPQKKLKLQ